MVLPSHHDKRRRSFAISTAAMVASLAAIVLAAVLYMSRGRTVAAGGMSQNGVATTAPVQSNSSANTVEASPTQFPDLGVDLEPAAAGAAPAISESQALAAVRADGMRSDVQAAITPQVRLAVFTNSILGQAGASQGPPKFANVLVWDIDYPNAPVEAHGRPADESGTVSLDPCDLHIIVDATSGAIIEGFQSCSNSAASQSAANRP